MTTQPAIDTLQTPSILVDRLRLDANIRSMQAACDTHGIELRPHIKTHKMVAVARRQLEAGARGLTCAKLGEAEVLPGECWSESPGRVHGRLVGCG